MSRREVRLDYVGRDRTGRATQSVTANLDQVRGKVNSLSTSLGKTQRLFTALTLGLSGTGAIRELGRLQDSFTRIRGLSTDFGKEQQFVSKQTRKLSLDLKGAADNYSQLLVLQNTGLIKNNQAEKLFVGLQESAAKFGTSTGDVNLAIRGIRQALTQGIVRAQEFDQVFDAIGAAQPKVAKQLGLTTKEFQKLRTSNSLAADTFVDALIPALLEFEGSAEKASGNINSSLRRLSTSYKEALLALQKPIGGSVAKFANAASAGIDALVKNADKIKLVGVAIAAAYGGRAIASVSAFAAAQARSIVVARAHGQAIIANNVLKAKQAAAALATAKAEQAAVVAVRQGVQAQLAGITASRARLAIAGQLTGARIAEMNATRALVLANTQATASTAALTASQRAASISGTALAATTRGLTAAMSLVGGPLGVAVIAGAGISFFLLRATKAQRVMGDLTTATRELNDEFKRIGTAVLDANKDKIAAVNAEIAILIKRRQEYASGEVPQPFFGSIDDAAAIRNLDRQIDALRGTIAKFSANEDALRYVDSLDQEMQALNISVRNVIRAAAGAGDSLVDKFLPDRKKIKELQETLASLDTSFNKGDDRKNDVAKAIQAEIDKLTGATEARKRYTEQISKAKSELESLISSLETEKQKLESTFDGQEQTVLLNAELGLVSEQSATALISRARESLNAKLGELAAQEVATEARRVEDVKRVRDQEITDLESYRNRMQQARSVVNPIGGELDRFKNQALALKSERDRDLISQQDYYTLLESAQAEHNARMTSFQDEEKNKRLEGFKTYESAITGIASSFASAFQKNAKSYIQINDSMTDAEKKNAEASNKINRKRFQQNKKAQIAQSLISTYTAAANAFRDIPYPLNFAAAAAVTAAGLRNVQNIRSTSFASTAGAGSSGTAPSLGSSDSSSTSDVNNTNPGQNTTVIFMSHRRTFADEAYEREVMASGVKSLVDEGLLAIEDGVLDTQNIIRRDVA